MKYYTYIHANQDGVVFYVGKGKGRRVYSMCDRSWEWHEEVKKHDGLLMRVINRFESEQEAFDDEQKLITEYKNKGFKLVNKTDGGAGLVGYGFTEQRKKHLSTLLTGYIHEKVQCPHCGKTGGETSMKRWHFDNCTGLKPYKARVTVLGKRVYLGYHKTKPMAEAVKKEFYDFVMEEYNSLIQSRADYAVRTLGEINVKYT